MIAEIASVMWVLSGRDEGGTSKTLFRRCDEAAKSPLLLLIPELGFSVNDFYGLARFLTVGKEPGRWRYTCLSTGDIPV